MQTGSKSCYRSVSRRSSLYKDCCSHWVRRILRNCSRNRKRLVKGSVEGDEVQNRLNEFGVGTFVVAMVLD